MYAKNGISAPGVYVGAPAPRAFTCWPSVVAGVNMLRNAEPGTVKTVPYGDFPVTWFAR